MKGVAWLLGAMMALGGGLTGKGCMGGSGTRVLTEADFGRQINVDVGDDVRVALREGAGEGYVWRYGWDPQRCLRLVHDHFVPNESTRPARDGVRNITFHVTAPGRIDLWVQEVERGPRGGVTRAKMYFILRAD
jgi:predicted secreted protein